MLEFLVENWLGIAGVLATVIVGFWTLRKISINVKSSDRVSVKNRTADTKTISVKNSKDVNIDV